MFDFDGAMLSTNCESQLCDEFVLVCYGGCDGVEELYGLVMSGWSGKPWMRAMTLTLQLSETVDATRLGLRSPSGVDRKLMSCSCS